MRKQRINKKNPGAGTLFEKKVKRLFYEKFNLHLDHLVSFSIGIGKIKKSHNFDLASKKDRVIVECKSYTWTTGGNSPSAKLGFLNEVMFYFSIAPKGYRKLLVMRKHKRRGVTLAEHYVNTYKHLIPSKTEIWECAGKALTRVY